jgi:hypothetical protein
MEEKTMWELQWLLAVTLLVITVYLGIITYVSYRVRADVEQIVRSHRHYDERFDEIESVLRDMDLRFGGQKQVSPGLQEAGLVANLRATSSDAWSEALKALDALEDEAPQLIIEDSFSARASREQLAERASAESVRHERNS